MPNTDLNVTTDPQEIKTWVEARGGVPSKVQFIKGTETSPNELRIAFPKGQHDDDAQLADLSWSAFFERMDAENLALAYQHETVTGEQSYFYKFVDRDNYEDELELPG